jgi:hypothetical protein
MTRQRMRVAVAFIDASPLEAGALSGGGGGSVNRAVFALHTMDHNFRQDRAPAPHDTSDGRRYPNPGFGKCDIVKVIEDWETVRSAP